MERDAHLAHVRCATERFADIVRSGPLDAPVPACPGWDLRALTIHMGDVHRWAREAALTAAAPTDVARFEPPDAATASGTELAEWLLAGADDLVVALANLDPRAATWHPFPVPRVAAVWPRRQAHETTIHRWDAERAVGELTPLDPELASDGIDEYFQLALPRLIVREQFTMPTTTFHVHCTDIAGEWLVTGTADGSLDVTRVHAKGDAALRGTAEAILLRLWNRLDDHDVLDVAGDPEVAAAWLALPGL